MLLPLCLRSTYQPRLVTELSRKVEQRPGCLFELKELHSWTDNVAKMLAAAKKKHQPETDFDPKAVAWFLNSLWQGSMLVVKGGVSEAMIRANLKLARNFVDGLFLQT